MHRVLSFAEAISDQYRFLQGWRLDPLLLFVQICLAGTAFTWALEAIRLRKEVDQGDVSFFSTRDASLAICSHSCLALLEISRQPKIVNAITLEVNVASHFREFRLFKRQTSM